MAAKDQRAPAAYDLDCEALAYDGGNGAHQANANPNANGNARASALRPISFLEGSPAFDPVIGRCLGGKLIVGERMGAGALGVVYRAKHVLLPVPVAVKILHTHRQLDPDFRARFLAEAQSASMLDHPSLVRVIDFGEERGGLMWLAMELLEGQSLDGVLGEQEEGRLPVERAVEIVLDVCAGLAHAHARGIIHGDVKPSNIVVVSLVDDDGDITERAKLCDFGVARMHGALSNDAEGAQSGMRPALGTPGYMSPEQCLGEDLDARSDVYSCGILLYELLTGDVPFAEAAPHAHAGVLRQHVRTSTMPASMRAEIEGRVDAIVSKAISKDREDRFGSMRDLRAALRELRAGLGLPPRASTLPPPPMSSATAAASRRLGGANNRSTTSSSSLASANRASEEITPVRAKIVSQVRELCADPQPAATSDLAAFLLARAELLDREKFALSELLQRGTADAVGWRVARLVARVESSRGRDTVAFEALRLLDTPANLHAFAERLLAEAVLPSPHITCVLQRGGRASARALWTARIARTGSIEERRTRFVSWMREVGPSAHDVLRAALLKLAPYAADGHRHVELIEDVLVALPMRCGDDLLAVTAAFAKSPVQRIRELALTVIARALD